MSWLHLVRPFKIETLTVTWPELPPLHADLSSALQGLKRLVKDSRCITTGDLFLALPGQTVHGKAYIQQALDQGARVILQPSPHAKASLQSLEAPAGQSYLLSLPQLSERLGAWLDLLTDSPSQRIRSLAVTGTNGKSSIAHLITQGQTFLGHQVALIGSLGYGSLEALHPTRHTTPDLLIMHDLYQRWAEAGIEQVALEASSHALDQGRLDGLKLDTALFTNLTRDHLDYHASLEGYGAAKLKLFQRPELRQGLVNLDCPFGRQITQYTWPYPIYTYSLDADSVADMRLLSAAFNPHGTRVRLAWRQEEYEVELPLLGRFNVANVLAVALFFHLSGLGRTQVQALLSALQPVPGRMECLTTQPGQPQVVIDYAHTPDALAQVLTSLREHTSGQLWCVFGCGGDRDTGKRPLMGQIAQQFADQIVITDDNPRHEDPAPIRAAILAQAGSQAIEIADRAAAIAYALHQAQAEDLVLIAGKGHETSQDWGYYQQPFQDAEIAQRCLSDRLGPRSC